MMDLQERKECTFSPDIRHNHAYSQSPHQGQESQESFNKKANNNNADNKDQKKHLTSARLN